MLVMGQGQALEGTVVVCCSTVVVNYQITEQKVAECPIKWHVKEDISAAESGDTWQTDPRDTEAVSQQASAPANLQDQML